MFCMFKIFTLVVLCLTFCNLLFSMSLLLENLAQFVFTNYLLLIVFRNYSPSPQRQWLLQNFNGEIACKAKWLRLQTDWYLELSHWRFLFTKIRGLWQSEKSLMGLTYSTHKMYFWVIIIKTHSGKKKISYCCLPNS